jgi:hypothetical protein
MTSRKCEACGREIFYAITPGGRRIPLEKAPILYRVRRGYSRLIAEPAEIVAPEHLYVCHYRTCSRLTGAAAEPVSEQQEFKLEQQGEV